MDLAREAFEAFNRRHIDALLGICDPEVEFLSMLPEAPSYRGHSGVRTWWDRILNTFPDWHGEVGRMRAFDDTVVSEIHAVAHGGGSGTPLDQTFWNVSRFRAGKVVWWSFCLSERDALEAAGVREQPLSRKRGWSARVFPGRHA